MGQTDSMTPRSADTIAILRIEIEDIEPLIWRRIAIRTSTNLLMLHKVIQVTMGWLDYHLWEFTVEGRKYAIPDPDNPARGAASKMARRQDLMTSSPAA